MGDSFARYPAARSWVMSFSLMEETIHLPWPPDPDMTTCFLEKGKDGNLGAGAREWKDREEEKAWLKKGDSYLLIKVVNIERLPTRLKTRLFPRAV